MKPLTILVLSAAAAIGSMPLVATADDARSLVENSLAPCGALSLRSAEERIADCATKNPESAVLLESSTTWELQHVSQAGEVVWFDRAHNNQRVRFKPTSGVNESLGGDFNLKSSAEVKAYLDLLTRSRKPESGAKPGFVNIVGDESGSSQIGVEQMMRNTKRTQRQSPEMFMRDTKRTQRQSPEMFMRNTKRTQRQSPEMLQSKATDFGTALDLEYYFNP